MVAQQKLKKITNRLRYKNSCTIDRVQCVSPCIEYSYAEVNNLSATIQKLEN